MKDIKITDWQRILFGQVPPEFFIELLIRTTIFFLLLVFSMHFFGKRMAAQINRIEVVALFTLAAAIGVPLETADMGILPAFVIAGVVVGVGRLLATIAFRNERTEAAIEDSLTILANDGVLDLKKMGGTLVTVDRLFAELRSKGYRHLGEVKRVYIEANGSFSLVKEENPDCGLCILPGYDREFSEAQPDAGEKVCWGCGKKKRDNPDSEICTNCKNERWENAIK
ncbi:MAG: hypothetical protein JWR18_3260 [Segetibacter sp.]|jgi:hypothetical protein|nr:hypothetical protein [Segetibacter sp.]